LETINPPPAKNSFSLSLLGEALYVFGGQIRHPRHETNDFHKLDLHTMEWTTLNQYVPKEEDDEEEDDKDYEDENEEEEEEENDEVVIKEGGDRASTEKYLPYGNGHTNGHYNEHDHEREEREREKKGELEKGKLLLRDEKKKEKQLPPVAPPSRADHSAVVFNKKIWLFGGFLGRRNFHRYLDIHVFDTGSFVLFVWVCCR